MPLKQLSSSTVKLITSTQIITSVSSVVKELMENALDAEANNIDVRLESNGLDRIEVKDDGCGINRTDTPNMCLPSFTSKICEYGDLDKLQSYGFRGEALSAICHVADVTITTRTSEDELAMMYTINNSGNIVTTKPSHFGKGTLVTVSGLFQNIPVRKQYLNSGRRAIGELKRAENVVKSLAVIHPGLRVTFCHNKCIVLQKSACTTLRQSLMQVTGHFISSKLEELVLREAELSVDMLVPKRETENLPALCLSNIECMMLYINNRPVRYKKLEKMVLKYISECFPGKLLTHKYPYCLVSIVTSPGEMDVNLEPNKTRVLLKEEDGVLSKIENLLSSYYGLKEDVHPVLHSPSLTALPGSESTFVESPSKQHNLGTNRGKVDKVEEQTRECKRLKLEDSAVDSLSNSNELSKSKAQNVAVIMTQLGKERFQNIPRTESVENVSYEERCLFVDLGALPSDNTVLENSVHNETLSTNASEMAGSGWTITKNICTNSNRDANRRFANGETICSTVSNIGHSNTSISERNPNEQSGKHELPSYLRNNELPLVPNRADGRSSECDFTPPICVKVTDDTNEAAARDMDRIKMFNSSTRTLKDKTDTVESVLQEKHTYVTNSNENPVHSVCKDVTDGADLDFLHSSDCNEENEIYALISRSTVAIPQDRSSLNENYGKTNSDKQTFSICDSVSDVAVGEDVWEAADFAIEKWSKGLLKAPNGNKLQGSSVLLPKAAATPKSTETLDSSCFSVSSQMGCKEQSAFTKFSREERPKIIQEIPGIAFTKVAELLVDRWRSLPIEERIKFEKLAKEMDKERKHIAGSISGQQMNSIKNYMNKSASSNTEIKRQKIRQRPHRRKVDLDVSLKKIKENGVPVHKELGNDVPILIGQLLPSGTWLYRRENEIGVVRHWGLQETVIYHRLKLDHVIPLKKLESSIPIDESILGPELWKVLLSLSKTYDVFTNAVIITSDVISRNGFRIEITEGSGRASCVLTEIASTLSFYGVNDLKDVLELIKNNGSSSLEKCRSQRVICYIRDEAVRVARQCPRVMERDTLQDLIHYWHSNLSHLGATCLHRKPFFFALKNLLAGELQEQKD